MQGPIADATGYKRALENKVQSLLELEGFPPLVLSSPSSFIASSQPVTTKTDDNGYGSTSDAPYTNRDESQLDTKGKNPELQ